jgi:RNA polymerase-binding transcription factor DksA
MDDHELEDIPRLLTSVWMKPFEEMRFHDALVCGFSNYMVAREVKDSEYEASFLLAMRETIERMLPQSEQAEKEECSFCGRRPPDVRLAAGPEVFICNVCVAILTESFRNST